MDDQVLHHTTCHILDPYFHLQPLVKYPLFFLPSCEVDFATAWSAPRLLHSPLSPLGHACHFRNLVCKYPTWDYPCHSRSRNQVKGNLVQKPRQTFAWLKVCTTLNLWGNDAFFAQELYPIFNTILCIWFLALSQACSMPGERGVFCNYVVTVPQTIDWFNTAISVQSSVSLGFLHPLACLFKSDPDMPTQKEADIGKSGPKDSVRNPPACRVLCTWWYGFTQDACWFGYANFRCKKKTWSLAHLILLHLAIPVWVQRDLLSLKRPFQFMMIGSVLKKKLAPPANHCWILSSERVH